MRPGGCPWLNPFLAAVSLQAAAGPNEPGRATSEMKNFAKKDAANSVFEGGKKEEKMRGKAGIVSGHFGPVFF